MNKLPLEKQVKIIQLITEGNSIRGTARIVDVSVNTVANLIIKTGKSCLRFHSSTVKNIRCDRVQCDEIWSFVHTKDKNVKDPKYGLGSVWTWIGMDSDSKLIISWFAGERTEEAAKFFMHDLWCRLGKRVQLTTDGLSCYRNAVWEHFKGNVDFAQLVKEYDKKNRKGKKIQKERYVGCHKEIICGNPNPKFISTSHVERQNLTIRMHLRRFARETNAFSKKMDNHCYALALHFVYYNFVKLHRTLNVTPAMRAGITKRFMKIEDILNLPD